MLSFDGEVDVSARQCGDCGRDFTLVKAFVLRDGSAHAVCFAACHVHDGEREAWIDLVLGTFGGDATADHVTFGVRVGPVAGQLEPAATLVQAAIPYGDAALFGRKLSREEALVHPCLPLCWDLIDWVLVADDTVNKHVYGR